MPSCLVFQYLMNNRPCLSTSLFAVSLLGTLACSSARMPEPRSAVAEYEQALKSLNEEELWALMSDEARLAIDRKELKHLLESQKAELLKRADELTQSESEITGQATLFLDDGREVELSIENGGFAISGDGVLPVASSTPLAAAQRLRSAVLAHNYQLLVMSLSENAAKQVNIIFEKLENSLEDLNEALVEERDGRATIELASGYRIYLIKEGNSWVVEDLQ